MPFSAAQGRGLSGFGKNHPRSAPVFFPKTLRAEALRCFAPESETTRCFTLKTEYNEYGNSIEKKETDMENHPHTAHGTRFQLSLHAGSISRVGCGRHRLLQEILPVPLRDSLPPGNTGHHRRHTEFSNLLII